MGVEWGKGGVLSLQGDFLGRNETSLMGQERSETRRRGELVEAFETGRKALF